jgi:hypothetical protein
MLAAVGNGSSSPFPAGRTPRLDGIYAHRSVRFIPVSWPRTACAAALAVLLSAASYLAAGKILFLHARIVSFLSNLSGIPVLGWSSVVPFARIAPVPAPVIHLPAFKDLSDLARLLLISAVVALLILSRRYVLTRNLAGFLILLLVCSAFGNALVPNYTFDSTVFALMWYRSELLVWILLPWAAGLLLVLPHRNASHGLALVVLAQFYGFIFSALRMTLLLGMLFHTGLLFFPTLWFLLGPLSDLLFVLFFYSISVYRNADRTWGARRAWQS